MPGTRCGGILNAGAGPTTAPERGTMRIGKHLVFGAIALALVCTAAIAADATSSTTTDVSTHGHGGVLLTKGRTRYWGASNSVLDYHGGRVMHTNSTFMIYWSPPGSTWQRGYMNAVNGFFQNVAADSGTGNDPYSTLLQYYDTAGHIGYRSTYAGSYVDHSAFPANGCPAYSTYTVCLTDAQQRAEVRRVVRQLDLPVDGTHGYFLYMPKNVGSCFDAAGTVCAFTYYCAYHGFDQNVLYASIPYAATDHRGCGVDNGPNASDADDTIDGASHEHREMIDDPYLSAWWDNKGYESSDKCAYIWGPTTQTAVGQYNQTINGHHYLLQEEWSNATKSCVQRGV
jgi:hypothetical protein